MLAIDAVDHGQAGVGLRGAEASAEAPTAATPVPERRFGGFPTPASTGVLYGILVLYVAVASTHSRGFVFDDPFIFFQYARNLAEGHGWVFNIGQPGANAATSPLYVVMLAVAYKLGLSLFGTSQALFVAGLAGCACLTHATLARLGHWWAGVAAACLIASSPWLFITRGMETPLFLGVFALCVYLWVKGATYGLGAALALLVLLRPDGIVLVVLIIAAKWIVDHRPPVRTLAVGGIIAAIWASYALVTIGTLLPDTLTAKIAQARSGYLSPTYLLGIVNTPSLYGFGKLATIVGVLGAFGLLVAAMRPELRLPLGVVIAAVAVVSVAYAAVGVPGAYPWYYASLVYVVAILAGVTIEEVGHQLGRHVRMVSVVVPVAVVLVLVVIGWRSTPIGPPRPGYNEAAAWIDAHTPPSATVASGEVGLLGWYTNHPIQDYLGLISPQAIAPLRRGDMTWWVDGLRPDYWMTEVHPFRFDEPVLDAPWIHQVFHEVYRNARDIVYRRVATAP